MEKSTLLDHSKSLLRGLNGGRSGSGSTNPFGKMMISALALSALAAPAALADEASLPDSVPVIEVATPAAPSVPSVDYVAEPAEQTPAGPNGWLVGGAMALIFAALVKLIGANRVMNMASEAGPKLKQAAETIASAPQEAARALGAAAARPVRFLLIMVSVAMVGFTGIAVFDLEWTAGILTGMGMTALTWLGSSRFIKMLKPIKLGLRNRK